MPIFQSEISADGLVLVPREICECMQIGPGSILEWVVRGERVVVKHGTGFTSSGDLNAGSGSRNTLRSFRATPSALGGDVA